MAAADDAQDADRAMAAAQAAYVALDVEAAVTHLSAAVRALTATGETRRAAMACAQLGDVLATGLGNLTAGRAWFARAERMVADEPPCIEQGWVAVAAMGCDVGDPVALLAASDLAVDRARRFGDVNLEVKGLADGGLALVQAGRVDEGMARLDEAMALACGPADDVINAARSVCSFFTACYYTADLERADTWTGLLRRQGLIGSTPGPIFLSNHCDSLQATLLCELGRWSEAEAVLLRATAEWDAVMPVPSFHSAIVLADLRIRQGRLAEAEALLVGKDQAFDALLPAARLHLARGDLDLALAASARGLRVAGAADRLRALELLTVAVDARLAAGDLAGAEAACADLAARAAGLDARTPAARAAAAQARVLAAGGQVDEAIALLEATVDGLDAGRLPWLRALLLLDLAGLREAGDRAGASLDAKAAAATLAGLDVVLPAAHAELLARLSAGPRAAGGPGPGRDASAPATLGRDGKWWVASHGGTTVRLQDSKGLRYLAALVARPGVEAHALDLADRADPAALSPDGATSVPARRALGDAGPVLDSAARAAYRRRIEQLRGAAEEALDAGRLDEAAALDEEVSAYVRELARAFGLGGRERRAASAAERARLNVTRALRAAIVRVADALPVAGAALDRGVRTGLYCAYEPGEGEAPRWIVQPGLNGGAPD